MEALGESASVNPTFPLTQVLYEQDLATARAPLDAAAFEESWAKGRSMTMEEAVAEALAEDVPLPENGP